MGDGEIKHNNMVQWDVALTGGLCKERKVGRKGEAAGAMITGHFIPHWKTERKRESAGTAAPVGSGHAGGRDGSVVRPAGHRIS